MPTDEEMRGLDDDIQYQILIGNSTLADGRLLQSSRDAGLSGQHGESVYHADKRDTSMLTVATTEAAIKATYFLPVAGGLFRKILTEMRGGFNAPGPDSESFYQRSKAANPELYPQATLAEFMSANPDGFEPKTEGIMFEWWETFGRASAMVSEQKPADVPVTVATTIGPPSSTDSDARFRENLAKVSSVFAGKTFEESQALAAIYDPSGFLRSSGALVLPGQPSTPSIGHKKL